MTPEPTEGEGQLEELRTALCLFLPPGMSASIRLFCGRTVYITVGVLSRTWACVVRRGSLEVVANEEVLLDVSDYYEQHQSISISLPSRVQWVNTRSYNTLVGLVFSQGPVLPGNMLDPCIDKTLMVRDSGKPEAATGL